MLALAWLAAPAAAQSRVRAVEVATDNDAYDFWIPMDSRPDQDYTHGMWLAVEQEGAPKWLRRFSPRTPACTAVGTPAEGACLATRWAVTQRLYTPRLDAPRPIAGERPYAGWLSASGEMRWIGERARRSVGVEMGVTGEPALGRPIQTAWHETFGFHRPLGWRNQIAFEPGVMVRWEEGRTLAGSGPGRPRTFDVTPRAGVVVGNVRTAGHAALRARLGSNLPHPWSGAREPGGGELSTWIVGGLRGELVARDLFLDGSTFADGPRVARRAAVGEWSGGVGASFRAVTAEYRVTARSREYRSQRPKPYGTISIRVERLP